MAMRVRKDPEVRRKELMDAAMELFVSVGYDKTMVADIVKKAGVAKGTFFYYFPSKEEVLEGLFHRWAVEILERCSCQCRQATALERLTFFVGQMLAPGAMDRLFDKLWEEGQANLLYKTWVKQVEALFNSLLEEIFQQGNQEKTMEVELVKESIAFFWSILDCLWEASYFKEEPDIVANKLRLAEGLLAGLLRIEGGALRLAIGGDGKKA